MKKFISLIVSLVIVLTALGLILPFAPESPAGGSPVTGGIPQLSLEGFSEAEIGLDPGSLSILLSSGCRQLRMVTSQEQMQSIAMGLEGDMGFRPLSHDLMGNMLEGFGIEVLMVKLEDLREGTYYAKLLLGQGSNILNMDSRPSDAIALAARTGSPVYVRQSLLEKYGEEIC